MDMKFSIGERVKIRGKDIIGEVVETEYRYYHYSNGEEKIVKRYLVKQIGNTYYQNWYEEDMLESVLELTEELSEEYAERIYDVLIDVALMTRNFDMVKKLVEEKKKYLK
ncbi:hypothetical protein AXJ14_gp091 [Geobacillus virus E3]|uniref:hypothetical protein n=1 Tax=Geobacillus virus E3 TaxID=1572712 RepID=UPI0006719CE9|nr:hypothetical protein AXJ14_gp091 [Geobacillus virus E3]AJA41410.1 hypothetical protein E3_091 [Geobacillus virus E3]